MDFSNSATYFILRLHSAKTILRNITYSQEWHLIPLITFNGYKQVSGPTHTPVEGLTQRWEHQEVGIFGGQLSVCQP